MLALETMHIKFFCSSRLRPIQLLRAMLVLGGAAVLNSLTGVDIYVSGII